MRHGLPMTLDFARLLSDERSLAGQKTSFPDMKGITRLTWGPFHRFWTQPSSLSASICPCDVDTRVETFVPWLTFGRVYRSLGCYIRKEVPQGEGEPCAFSTIPEKALYSHFCLERNERNGAASK
jgi:hypothetical protein